MNYIDFATNIKAKYPVYGDMDERELAERIISKYPVYADQVEFDLPQIPEAPFETEPALQPEPSFAEAPALTTAVAPPSVAPLPEGEPFAFPGTEPPVEPEAPIFGEVAPEQPLPEAPPPIPDPTFEETAALEAPPVSTDVALAPPTPTEELPIISEPSPESLEQMRLTEEADVAAETAESVRQEKGTIGEKLEEIEQIIGGPIDPVQAAYLFMGLEPPSKEELALSKIGRAGPAVATGVKAAVQEVFGDEPQYKTQQQRRGHVFTETVEKLKSESQQKELEEEITVKEELEKPERIEKAAEVKEAPAAALAVAKTPEEIKTEQDVKEDIARGKELSEQMEPEVREAVGAIPWIKNFAKEAVYMTLDDGLYWMVGFGGLKRAQTLGKAALKYGNTSKQVDKLIDKLRLANEVKFAKFMGKTAAETAIFLAPEAMRKAEVPPTPEILATGAVVGGLRLAPKVVKGVAKEVKKKVKEAEPFVKKAAGREAEPIKPEPKKIKLEPLKEKKTTVKEAEDVLDPGTSIEKQMESYAKEDFIYMQAGPGMTPAQKTAVKEGAKKIGKWVAEQADDLFYSKQRVPINARKLYEHMVLTTQSMLFDSGRAINKIERDLSAKVLGKATRADKPLRELVPFVIEKTGKEELTAALEKIGRKDLIARMEKLTPEDRKALNQTAKDVSKHFDKGWEYMKANLDNLTAEQVENYVTHIWEFPDKKSLSGFVGKFNTRNPLLKKRFIATIQEGINKHNLKPKTLDIAEIVKIHDEYMIKTTENKLFLKNIFKLQDQGGGKMIMRIDKAPSNWLYMDHPLLKMKVYIPGKKGEPAAIVPIGVKYHPDLDAMMKATFGGTKVLEGMPFVQKMATPLVLANAFMKKTQLSLSMFHHFALGETAFPTMKASAKEIGGVFKVANPFQKDVFNAVVNKQFSIYGKKHLLAKDGVNHGLQLGASSDVMRTQFQKMLETLEKGSKKVGLDAPVRGLRWFNDAWDRGLWDYYHNELKLMAYESLVARHVPKGTKLSDIVLKKKEIASIVNDTFGGQNWELLMTNKKTLSLAQGLLLSPDWTKSTIKQALAPTGIGAMYKDTAALRKKMGVEFWAKAGLYYWGGVNMLNVVSKVYDESERYDRPYKDILAELAKDPKKFMSYTMLGNDPGHKTHLLAGRFSDGKKRYIRWGKQFRELPEFFYSVGDVWWAPNPIYAGRKKIGGKMSPVIQVISQFFTGKTPSGYSTRELDHKTGWTWVGKMAHLMIKSPLPFSVQTMLDEKKEWIITDLAFPSSKGMTRHKAIKYFKQAINQKDEAFFYRVHKAADENDLPASEYAYDAMLEMQKQATADVRDELKKKGYTTPKNILELGQTVKLGLEDEIKLRKLEAMRAVETMAREQWKAYQNWEKDATEERELEEMLEEGKRGETIPSGGSAKEFEEFYGIKLKK